MNEATHRETDTGKIVEGEGWFVLNVAEASWQTMPKADSGTWLDFESPDQRNEHYGIGIHVLMPGQANGRYHAESAQEGFLVLAGECIALVEGQERRLRQWDYLHCPPETEHIMVGAGDGPCAILMTGARFEGRRIRYEVSDLAARYGASVKQPTTSGKEAYADLDRTITRRPAPWPPRD